MSGVIYWFRQDLRLADNPALLQACATADRLLPVFVHPPASETTRWGFARVGAHRRFFLQSALDDLDAKLRARGSRLLQLEGDPAECLARLAAASGCSRIVCERIAAPEEDDAVSVLRAQGLEVDTVWQSTLLPPERLPFAIDALPQVFTNFRQAVERAGILPDDPLPAPGRLPPWPECEIETGRPLTRPVDSPPSVRAEPVEARPESPSFPYWTARCQGGESTALQHLQEYFSSSRVRDYKATRNQLEGFGFSSKLSPWLAQGAISARQAYAALKAFEAEQGASDGSYWLWFELLWRDHFRLLHLQHGRRLYRANGLRDKPDSAHRPAHDPAAFERWRSGSTGEELVDAGMRELRATGFLSNRMRQIVASHLIHDLRCDWRAGAAWFEAQLIDYDVYSNQGNWLYIAGLGTDPRGGRRFDPLKQAREHDADGRYRARWAAAGAAEMRTSG